MFVITWTKMKIKILIYLSMAYYIFITWETGGAASYIFFPSSWSEFEIRGSKNCEKYIQGLKMMDEIAEVST